MISEKIFFVPLFRNQKTVSVSLGVMPFIYSTSRYVSACFEGVHAITEVLVSSCVNIFYFIHDLTGKRKRKRNFEVPQN